MILITGASGNVGKEVLKQMTQTGAKVRAAFQSVSKSASAPSGVDLCTVDYNQPETLREALTGVDRVFLVGPPTAQLLERKAMDVIRQSEVRMVSEALGDGRARSDIPTATCSIGRLHPIDGCGLYASASQRLYAEPGQLRCTNY